MPRALDRPSLARDLGASVTRSSVVLLTALLLGACSDRNPCAPLVYDPATRACRCPDGMAFDEETATCVVPLPNAPTITIDPATPRTDDALVVRIETESVDPEGSEVEYEYEWTRDGADADHRTARIESEATHRDEEWTVRVTAVTSDGRRSSAAAASVTIANTPPSLATVGLHAYRPMLGEELRASTARAVDPDGDPVSIEWSWLRNGMEIPGSSTESFSVTSVEPGDEIRVLARPFDDVAEGEPVTAGPAIVLDRATRWRALVPDRNTTAAPVIAYDPTHHRVLLASWSGTGSGTPELWEFGLDDGLRSFVRLFPSGEAPNVISASHVYDSANQRIIVFGGIDGDGPTNRTWVLDVARRGEESWRRIGELGVAPPPRHAPNVGYDPATRRMFVIGGLAPGLTPLQDIWSLDLSDASGGWTLHAASAPPTFQGTMVHDLGRSRMLVFGGALVGSSGYVTSDRIHTFDPSNPNAGVLELPARLPAPVSGPLVARDPASGAWIVAGGLEDYALRRIATQAWALDPSDLSAARLELTGAPAVLAAGWMQPFEGILLAHPRHPFSNETVRFDLHTFEPSTGRWTPIMVQGIHLPLDRMGAAFAEQRGRAFMIGGRVSEGQLLADVWSLSLGPGSTGVAWTRLDLLPDVATGRSPSARFGALGNLLRGEVVLLGGRDESGFAETALWSSDGVRWREQRVTTPEGAPLAGRADGVVVDGCGRAVISGGETEDRASDLRSIECVGGDECSVTVVNAQEPSDRWGAAVAFSEPVGGRILVGGRSIAGAHGDVWLFESCASGWRRPLQVTGAVLPARSGHTLTFEAGRTPAGSYLVFGGVGPDRIPVDSGVWRLTRVGDDEWSWSPITVAPGEAPIGRSQHVATWDDVRQRLFVFGGSAPGSGDALGDMWELVISD